MKDLPNDYVLIDEAMALEFEKRLKESMRLGGEENSYLANRRRPKQNIGAPLREFVELYLSTRQAKDVSRQRYVLNDYFLPIVEGGKNGNQA